MTNSVIALPSIGKDDRIDLTLPEGMTIAAIVAAALPGATETDLKFVRVHVVSEHGMTLISREAWRLAKPKPGFKVIVRVVPGQNAIRTLLQVVVSIAAVALGQYWALGLGFAIGTTGFAVASGLIGLGVSIVGNLLINALIPPEKPKTRDEKPNFEITGWKNRFEPNGIEPEVLGTVRYAPPFAAPPYSEIVGDDQFIVALFTFGPGPLSITAHRLGDTELEEYDEIEKYVYEGTTAKPPLKLYTRQRVAENVGAELIRAYPRDDAGEIIEGSSPELKRVVRTTGADASAFSVVLSFPAGLVRYDSKGNPRSTSCAVRIERRLSGANAWTTVQTLTITATKTEGFHRQFTRNLPSRGKWDIAVTMVTAEVLPGQNVQRRCAWSELQTIRPESPLALDRPTGIVEMRVKATHQLNGALDNYNALVSRLCPDWDENQGRWISRATSSPASLYRLALQSPNNPKPVADAGVDLVTLQEFHKFCRVRDLKYDRVLEEDGRLDEKLAEIASAGRGLPRHDGVRYSVVIDRPRDLPVVDHVSPRNSWSFETQITYIDPPHGFRVPFLDATNDYKPAERIVPWPGHTGPVTLTEQLDLPGKTDPDEIWVESRRRMYEATYRFATHTCLQGGPVRSATRGDLVMLNTDVLDRVQKAARVRAVDGDHVTLDASVEMVDGVSYALRFRSYSGPNDNMGASVIRPVLTVPGERSALLLVGAGGNAPRVGTLVSFGRATAVSRPVVITRLEAGTDMSVVLRMADAAPQIDDLTDAEIPPLWTGRVGEEIGDGGLAPPALRFSSITTGVVAGEDGAISVTFVPLSGPGTAAIYRLEHRLTGAPTFNHVDFPATDGGITLDPDDTGYANGDQVDLRAIAYSAGGTPSSGFSPTVDVTIGGNDAPIPAALDPSVVTVGPLLGGAVVQFQSNADSSTVNVRLWHSATSVLDPDTDTIAATVAVVPSRSWSQPVGDTTRENLLTNAWSYGPGWSAAGDGAQHLPGSASDLAHVLALTAGKYYRAGFTLDAAAGSLTPRLTGGTPVAGTARSADGLWSDRLLAASGNTAFALTASSTADLFVEDAFLFLETATSLPAGTHYFFLEPLNADDVGGPVAGPFSVVIR